MIWIGSFALAMLGAFIARNLAAAYVAIAAFIIIGFLHAIEMKLDKLLAHFNIPRVDIGRNKPHAPGASADTLPPFFFRLPPHRLARLVLHLDPIRRAPET